MIVFLSVLVKTAKASLINAIVLISKLEFLNMVVDVPIRAEDIVSAFCRMPLPRSDDRKCGVGAELGWRRLQIQYMVPSRNRVSIVMSPITPNQIRDFWETSRFSKCALILVSVPPSMCHLVKIIRVMTTGKAATIKPNRLNSS